MRNNFSLNQNTCSNCRPNRFRVESIHLLPISKLTGCVADSSYRFKIKCNQSKWNRSLHDESFTPVSLRGLLTFQYSTRLCRVCKTPDRLFLLRFMEARGRCMFCVFTVSDIVSSLVEIKMSAVR